MNDKKKYITETLQSIEAKKKSLKLKKIKIIKSINALKIEEKELKKELKKINQSDQLIVSVGFDKRWSSYNCIVKFRTFHFSIYLGNEQKIKKALQQFHKNDINDKKIEVIKTEIKQSKIELTKELNRVLEKMIINNPNQWIWTHDRWK